MSAMLLDQVLGHAVMLTGRIGLTRALEVSYRRPVPLGVPLRLTAAVADQDDTRIEVTGTIATAAEPDAVLVSARGTFVLPRPDQVRRIFGHVQAPGDRRPLPTGD
jgi:acyl-CoA thioesterase FadM